MAETLPISDRREFFSRKSNAIEVFAAIGVPGTIRILSRLLAPAETDPRPTPTTRPR